jgi:diguanylate cyclase (GGDEF)-like protein/PAS domain S-box-containing protein
VARISAVAAAVALIVVAFLTPDSPTGRGAYLLVTGGAAVAAAIGAKRATGNRVAILIAIGLGLSFVGDAIFEAILTSTGEETYASAADLGWLGSYLVIGAALLRLLRDAGRRIDLDGYIDIAAVFVLGLLLQWQLILQGLLEDTSVSVPVRLLWAAYPIGDAALLALLVRVALSRQVRGRASVLLAAGALAWLASDTAYTVPAIAERFAPWLNTGWMAGAGLMAMAAWQVARPDAESDARGTDDAVGYARVAVAVAPLPVPVLIAMTSENANRLVIGGCSLALLAIAAVRAIRLLQVAAEARRQIAAQERFARILAGNSSDAVAILDVDGTIRNDDPGLAALLACPGTSVQGRSMLEFIQDGDRAAAEDAFDRCLAEPGQRNLLELEVRRTDARRTWVAARVVNLLDDPVVGGVLVNLHDISPRKRVERELEHQAFHDSLTGLANRALFSNRVEHAVDRGSRTGRHPAVIFLDLDGFKAVNDTLGHDAGDRLLQQVAARLLESVRDGDTVARLGGDEFAVLVEESLRPLEEAAAVADRALAAIRKPIEIDGQVLPVTASAGLTTGDARSTATTLLRDADAAMYAAKAAGKACWVPYDPEMRAAAAERMELERDLAGALGRHELRLVYQPIVDLDTRDVTGFEALLRWDHPTIGLVAPDRFIPIAEESGLINPIGRWVLMEACSTAARWGRNHLGGGDLTMSVNVSGYQLRHADIAADVEAALTRSGLAASSLVLEITESALVGDIDIAARRLGEVRDLGVRIAIDDFGTGYSSLTYLRRFPVDILKIDRSFVSGIQDGEVPPMVRGLLDLGRTLDLVTVAEGVELDAQAELLHDQRCSHAQGFLFAHPLEPEEVELLLLRSTAAVRGSRSS